MGCGSSKTVQIAPSIVIRGSRSNTTSPNESSTSSRPRSVSPSSGPEASEDKCISLQTVVFIHRSIRRYLANVRLKKFQKRSAMEKEIDVHVLSTPEEETESVERLSKYLTSPYEGERSKAYAIFRWLSFNVAYDADGFFGRTEKKSSDPGSVLKHRLCVCGGYANLFEALGKGAGLKVPIGGLRVTAMNQVSPFNLKSCVECRADAEWFTAEPTWEAGFLGEI